MRSHENSASYLPKLDTGYLAARTWVEMLLLLVAALSAPRHHHRRHRHHHRLSLSESTHNDLERREPLPDWLTDVAEKSLRGQS